jgi:hypothetical protein
VIDLPEARELAPEQAAVVRRRLLSTMLADPPLVEPPTTPRRTGAFVAGAVLVCVLVGAGLAAAVAITLTAAHRSATDAVSAGSVMLDVLYDGHRITQDDLAALTKQGRGTFTTTDPDTENDLHATRAFDTLAELDAYSAEYLAWQKAKADGEDVDAWGTLHP